MVTKKQLRQYNNWYRTQQLFRYLKKKHSGGTSNSKGNAFENYFTVFRIAQLIDQNADPVNTLFSSQELCFIDDLVIELNAVNRIEHYQIKDVQGLSWVSAKSKHTIASDFQHQHTVLSATGKTIDLQLIVSRVAVKTDLDLKKPASITPYVTVTQFDTADSISNLVRTSKTFRDELTKICAITNPALNTLETLGAIILGVWDATNKHGIPLDNIIASCHNINPHYMIGFSGTLEPKLAAILSGVPGFTFLFQNGFLRWEFKPTDSGTFPHPLGTQEFVQFQNDIYNLGTNLVFDDIETYLV